MPDSRPRQRAGWPPANGADAEGWGPSTATYSASGHPSGDRFQVPQVPTSAAAQRRPLPANDGWAPAGPPTREKQRANRLMERRLEQIQADQPSERGLPGWAALVVLVVIAGIGGAIDTIGSIQVRGGFNVGIIVASIIGILIVRRSHMFPIVIAPPIVYSLGAVFQLYLRSSGLHDKKVVLDAAANYLVYGFPAIAAATAAVLIIAGIRLIAHR